MQVIRWTWSALFILTVTILLSSCAAFEDPSKKATQNAQSTALWTRVYDLETQQATIVALRLTADSANNMATQLANANSQINILRATGAAQEIRPANTPGLLPTPIGGGSAAGVIPSPSPSTSTGTSYVQTTVATTIDNNGCPTQSQNTFTTSTNMIYFVTRALGVTPGISFSLRVTLSNQVIATDPNFWVSDQIYEDTCIWYGLDRDNFPFSPGMYTVEFLANNVTVAQAIFVIADDTTSQ